MAVYGTPNPFIDDITSPPLRDNEAKIRLSYRDGGGEVGEVVSASIAGHA